MEMVEMMMLAARRRRGLGAVAGAVASSFAGWPSANFWAMRWRAGRRRRDGRYQSGLHGCHVPRAVR